MIQEITYDSLFLDQLKLINSIFSGKLHNFTFLAIFNYTMIWIFITWYADFTFIIRNFHNNHKISFYFSTFRFLSVKKWLLRKKHQIELARKRGWKGYWVCLKGTTLLFYPCDSREGRSIESAPKHLIIVDGAIMQPIPEHPKRDYIFCLSTAFGDAYLFQAPCQVSY